MKRNRYLIGLFVVLLVVTFFVLRKETGNISTNEISEKFVKFDSSTVDKIEINKKGEKIIIEKNIGEWILTYPVKYPTDQETITKLISETKSGKLVNLVSSNQEKQTLFQVDSLGTVVSFYVKGVKTDEIIIGKPGPDYMSTYIRKINSNDVYLVDKSLSFEFNKSVKDWRDKSIFKVPIHTIKQIKYQYSDTVFVITKEQNGWLIDNDSINTNVFESLLTGLSNIMADDFVDTNLVLPKLTTSIEITSANQDIIRFYQIPGSQKYYIQNNAKPQIFVLEQYNASNILKRKKDLKK